MTRLQAEWQRLYRLPTTSGAELGTGAQAQPSMTRALVLELAQPCAWDALSPVWRAVQSELALPAPGIAVNGVDGLQLWFSLAEPVTVTQAHTFLGRLSDRYLTGTGIAPAHIRLRLGEQVSPPPTQAAGNGADTGNWSAFVAPDLAPLFNETPWLDIPPGDDGQAQLLSSLASITPAMLAAALAQLTAAADVATAQTAASPTAPASPGQDPVRNHGAHLDAQRFLLAVMNDDSAPLALRIEAAKALLPFGPTTPP